MAPTWVVPGLLVGAFLGKSAQLLQWLVFFSFFFVRLQSHSDWATFLTIETTKTTSIRGQVRSAEISAKGSPFHFLPFLRNLQNRKRPKGPPFQFFFGTVRNFFRKFFKVSKESPLRVFWYFATKCMLINPKGSPFSFFGTMRHFRSFFKKKFFKKIFKFYFVPSRETVIFQSYRAWKAHFGSLQSVFKAFHEYVLSIFRKLCASWALDIAPTLDVPVLLCFCRTILTVCENLVVF